MRNENLRRLLGLEKAAERGPALAALADVLKSKLASGAGHACSRPASALPVGTGHWGALYGAHSVPIGQASSAPLLRRLLAALAAGPRLRFARPFADLFFLCLNNASTICDHSGLLAHSDPGHRHGTMLSRC